jgi:hypothetical protein
MRWDNLERSEAEGIILRGIAWSLCLPIIIQRELT